MSGRPVAGVEDGYRIVPGWLDKMLARAEKGDPEGDFRRHWLLTALLEDYFAFRGRWYLGPKSSLAFLQNEQPDHYAAFCRALARGRVAR